MNSNKYERTKQIYFSEKGSNSTIKATQDNLKSMESILEGYYKDNALFSCKYDDLCELLAKSEKLALNIRSAMSVNEEDKIQYLDKKNDTVIVEDEKTFLKKNGVYYENQISEKLKGKGFENYPVEIRTQDDMLEVYTPLTFKRGFSKTNNIDNYLLGIYIKNAIKNLLINGDIKPYKMIETPYYIVMKRVSKDFKLHKVFDADNLENQKIINIISEALSLPDNGQFMSIVSLWDQESDTQKEGTYFYVFSQKNLEKYLHLLKKKERP